MSKTDQIYAEALPEIPVFNFDSAVADVFTDMINRSVPGYQSVLGILGSLSTKQVIKNTNVYDLGCSLGAASLMMQQHIPYTTVNILAIDNSSAMVEKARQQLNLELEPQIHLFCEDVLDTIIENASLVCLNLTLQFVDPDKRTTLLKTIYEGLNPGGALLLFEKVRFEDEAENQHMIELYHDYKAANGYTEMEISQKRSALEQSLIPDTPESHESRLDVIGYQPVTRVFQALNFIAWVAWKPADA